MKQIVKWSCKCDAKGTVEYETPGNPYAVGLQCYEAHSKTSPQCTYGPKDLDFDPERLP